MALLQILCPNYTDLHISKQGAHFSEVEVLAPVFEKSDIEP